MQPYLFPAPAYLQLARAVDVFVFYDDALFSHGRWTHRNRIQVAGEPHLFTVPLSGRGPAKPLNAIDLDPRGYDRWRRKFLALIRQAYASAPHVRPVARDLEALLQEDHRTLAGLAAASVRWLSERFGIDPLWRSAATLDYDRAASAQAKVLEMVERMDGTVYINTPGGRSLYNPSAFRAGGVRLGFVENTAQAGEDQFLSALHAVLHRSPEELARMAADFRIEWGASA